MSNDELYHYGVLGQKWGIRRYQNKDGTLTSEGRLRYQKTVNEMANKGFKKGVGREDLIKERTIPSGTKMYRTSANPDEKLNGSVYVSYTDVDRNHYKNGWIRSTAGANKAYEYEFTLNEDLKIPSREHQEEVVAKVIKSNKKYLNETVEAYVDVTMPKGSWLRFEVENYYEGGIKKYTDEMISEWGERKPEELAFNVCQSLGLATNVKNQIINTLKKEGYNAMADEASIGGQNGWAKEGYDPLILFDSSVMSKNSVKEISRREERKALNKDANWKGKVSGYSGQWSAI